MKAFIDRNWFLRQHGRKSRARAVGIIVVGGGASIDDTVEALGRYVGSSSFDSIAEDKRFIVTACAGAPGDVKSNKQSIEEARDLGRQLAASLK